MTLVLLACSGAIFLKGFSEAIGLAVALVAIYLALNVVVVGWGILTSSQHPDSCRSLADRAARRSTATR